MDTRNHNAAAPQLQHNRGEPLANLGFLLGSCPPSSCLVGMGSCSGSWACSSFSCSRLDFRRPGFLDASSFLPNCARFRKRMASVACSLARLMKKSKLCLHASDLRSCFYVTLEFLLITIISSCHSDPVSHVQSSGGVAALGKQKAVVAGRADAKNRRNPLGDIGNYVSVHPTEGYERNQTP
jgi:hypothetical protein